MIVKLAKNDSLWVDYIAWILQGVQTLSEQSNFDAMLRKSGQISKVKIVSWSQMMRNLL